MADKIQKSSLEKKLILFILLASSLITTFFTSISFYYDYLTEKQILNATVEQIQKSNLNSLAAALWDYDTEQIETQARGILDIPNIVSVTIFNEFQEETYHETHYLQNYESKEDVKFPLVIQGKGVKPHQVGRLDIIFTKDHIHEKIKNRAVYFFLSQGIKTLMISIIMLFIFRWYIFRHIRKMAQFVSRFDISEATKTNETLAFDYKFSGKNELTALRDSLNELIDFIRKYEVSNTHELKMQKALAINSARLASLGDMASGLAHEINNPLAIIQNAANQVSRVLETKDNSRLEKLAPRNLKIIEKNVWRIAEIIQALRSFAREGDKQDLQESKTSKLIKDALDVCEARAQLLGVRISTDPDSDHSLILCIPNEITQIILELILNALHTLKNETNGWISIRAFKKDQFAVVEVTNSGPKIPEDLADKIFTPFFTTKEIGEGMGLGLSIALGTARRHGGRLYCDLNSEKTCFSLEIPLKPPVVT